MSDDRRRTLTLVLCCLAQFMIVLDVSIVNVALPSISADLRFAPAQLQWVVNAYTLTYAGFLLLGGRAADLLGDPAHRLSEALSAHRLEEVVHRLEVEGLDGEVLMGGDEDDQREPGEAGQQPGDVEAGQSRHPDVEEQHVEGVLAAGSGLQGPADPAHASVASVAPST